MKNILLAVAVLITPASSLGGRHQGPDTSCAAVVPDTKGAITEVTLQFDPYMPDLLEPMYRDLFNSLPPDVRVKVLCPSRAAAEQFTDLWGAYADDREICVINVGFPISAWARDRCIVRQQNGSRNTGCFVPSTHFSYVQEHENELSIQPLLYEAHLTPPPLMGWLHLEGGNVVSNSRHVFVGMNVLRDNAPALKGRILQTLRRVLGRRFMLIGDRFGDVPWEHLDMYLTPIDDQTVLVANPNLAWELLSAYTNDPGNNGELDELLGDTCLGDTLQDQFDDIAATLYDRGYRVRRLPALVDRLGDWLINYNNVVMEERDNCQIVYMPIYGIQILDRFAEAVYRAHGFEVRTVDVSQVYVHGGALRCLVNVTDRRPAQPARKSPSQTASTGLRVIDLSTPPPHPSREATVARQPALQLRKVQ